LDLAEALKLIAAAHDACTPCQETHLVNVLGGPPEVVAHLASVTYLAIAVKLEAMRSHLSGVLPGADGPLRPAMATTLAAATRTVYSALEKGDPVGAEQAVRDMGRAERRDLLEDVLDGLIGLMAVRVVR
jgi:urease alpha subunit